MIRIRELAIPESVVVLNGFLFSTFQIQLRETAWDHKKYVRVIRKLETMFFRMGKRRESLGELYVLCDNSSYKRSSYAEFTVL